MKEVRVVIVDDSAFSVAYIRSILENNGYQVVGSAGTLEEVKAVVKETRPTLVTMDMTLPGTDGLECTRAVHEIDSGINVIVVSSMMDEELIRNAKRNRVSAYVQKPIDSDELLMMIKRIIGAEELYQFLAAEYFDVFKEALMDAVNKMTKTLLTFQASYQNDKECYSAGVTTIIGVIGESSGRMLLDLSQETAANLTRAIFHRDPISNDEIVATLAEFSNIVAGNACSILNRKNKALGLRVAPPSILTGENVQISCPDFETHTAVAATAFGEICLNIGFKEGEGKWM